MRTLPSQPLEHAIQTAIVQFLRYSGWYVMRLNSGKFSVGTGAARRFINGQDAGTPDLVAFKKISFGLNQEDVEPVTYRGTKLVFIEVKRPGAKCTPLQLAKQEELRGHGATVIVATSVEEVQDALKRL